MNGDNVTYFDLLCFGVEYIPKEIEEFKDNKNIIKYIYRIQVYYSITKDTFVLYLLISCSKVKVC